MKEMMANDRAKHNILPLSKFGLMQISVNVFVPIRISILRKLVLLVLEQGK
jgi:hypothetical protein